MMKEDLLDPMSMKFSVKYSVNISIMICNTYHIGKLHSSKNSIEQQWHSFEKILEVSRSMLILESLYEVY